ncbi:MAG: hypothetical protein ACRBB0_15225 [Pelagimonas sp.]|uniref:hypothetical protein n=1 Tax=Pelagimonas sp. TaxID=2073170 RepID=UPI003D6C3E56
MTEFNLGQSFGQGIAIGNAVRQTRQQNALADIYSQHGKGIASGEQNALNALAGLDPMMAIKIQRQQAADGRADESHNFQMESGRARLGMDRESHGASMQLNKARLDQIESQAAQAMQQHAAQMSEAERAKEAQETQIALAHGKSAFVQGEAGVAQWVQRYAVELAEAGMPPETVNVDNFPEVLKVLNGFSTALSGGQVDLGGMVPEQPAPMSGHGKFYHDQQAGLIPPDAQYKGSGVTVNNNMGGAPALGKLSTDYGYVLDPETGQPVIDPATGLPTAAAVPGSQAAQELADAQGKVAEQGAARENAADVVTTAASRAKAADNDRVLRGMFGRLASVNPSSDNAEVYRQVDVLKSIASAEALNAMRRQSPTGGALGNVTEKELKLLSEQAGALDPASPNFQRDLDDYEAAIMRTIHGPGYSSGGDVSQMDATEIQDLMQKMPPDQMSPELRAELAARLRMLKGGQ